MHVADPLSVQSSSTAAFGSAHQRLAVAEVTVLGDHDPALCVGEASDLGI